MLNDKILIVPAILILALLACYKPDKIIIDFFMILASGLFGLVGGVGLANTKNRKDKTKQEVPK